MENCYYIVEWAKDCYPFPDDCGKRTFSNKEAAKNFRDTKDKKGCRARLITKSIFDDEEDY